MKKLFELWNKIPRGLQYFLVSAGVAFVRQKAPDLLPAELTPTTIMGGGLGFALLHHLEDRLPAEPAK